MRHNSAAKAGARVSEIGLPSIDTWPLDKLIPYARNPRKNDAAVDRMVSSIKEFGFKIPCLVRGDGEVVDGHLRLKAARQLGIAEVPVILCDEWTPAQVKAFRLMVNRSVAWADWDEDLLALELADLNAADFDLSRTGFGEEELQRFLDAEVSSEGLTDEDAVPEISETPVSIPGDLWVLGTHRVLCGDATVSADFQKLMDGASADLIFTDPPYNVDYEGYTEDRLKIRGDSMTAEQFQHFLLATFTSYRSITNPGASMYVCHSSSWQREFQNALKSADFTVRCQIIWAKNTFAWGFGRYKFQHELL